MPAPTKGNTRVRFLTNVTHGFHPDSEAYPGEPQIKRFPGATYTEVVPQSRQYEAGKVYDLPTVDAEDLVDRGLAEIVDSKDVKPENEDELHARARAAHAKAEAKRPAPSAPTMAPAAEPVADDDDEAGGK